MRQVLLGLWERMQGALAVGVSWLGLFRRPRAKAARARRGPRETPRDPLARGIVLSLISHRERFDCRRSEKTWEDWLSSRTAAFDCHETQKAAMAGLQEVLHRNFLRGRLEPLWPSRNGVLAPCVFLPRGVDRGNTWRELRNLAWETRWWPIEVDDLELLVGGFEQASPAQSVQDALDEACALDVLKEAPTEAKTTEDARAEEPASGETATEGGETEGTSLQAGPAEAAPAGEKARQDVPVPEKSKPWHFLDAPEADPVPGDFLVLVPTAQPWEIPAHLFYGGWSACPRSAVHVAWWKRWFDLYGAEIRTISGRAIDLYVSRLPATREEARTLLGEHGRYCPLAAGSDGSAAEERALDRLLKNRAWAFWWE